MKRSQIVMSGILLILIYSGINAYQKKRVSCYEIVHVGDSISADILLDKCKGRTWALVRDEGTPGEIMGYTPTEEEEKVKTLVWTRIYRGEGMLSLGEVKK